MFCVRYMKLHGAGLKGFIQKNWTRTVGTAGKQLGKNVINNPQRAFELGQQAAMAAISKNPALLGKTALDVGTFYRTGRGAEGRQPPVGDTSCLKACDQRSWRPPVDSVGHSVSGARASAGRGHFVSGAVPVKGTKTQGRTRWSKACDQRSWRRAKPYDSVGYSGGGLYLKRER